MSTTVDERVVSMKLDADQFLQPAQQVLGALTQIKNDTQADNSKGTLFDKLGAAIKGINLSPLENGVSAVHQGFSALEIMGVTALTNITNKAINAGTQIAKSLTLEPVMQGYTEYGLKMGSIKSIMASTGEDLDTVKGYLEELNHYADKTIYSFSDMTTNINKFTNAGMSLEDSVQAIQGVANLAGVAGASAQQASSAMYNFGQAMGTGTLLLQDWRSIENAGMATQQFQQVLAETAIEMGTLKIEEGKLVTSTTDAKGAVGEFGEVVDGNIVSLTGFRDALSKKFITGDVLTAALAKYSDPMTELGQMAAEATTSIETWSQLLDVTKESIGSGWAQTFEYILGDFEESRALLKEVNGIVESITSTIFDSMHSVLKTWRAYNGREKLMESLFNAFDALKSIVTPLKDALTEVFKPLDATDLWDITMAINKFTKSLVLSSETQEKLKNIFKGFFSLFDIGKQIITGFIDAVKPVIRVIFPDLSSSVLDSANTLSDFIQQLSANLKENKTFYNFFVKAIEGIKNGFEQLDTVFKRFSGSTIGEKLAEIKGSIWSFITGLFDKKETSPTNKVDAFFNEFSEKFNGGFGKLNDILAVVKDKLSSFAAGLKNSVSNFISKISGAFFKSKEAVEDNSEDLKEDVEKGGQFVFPNFDIMSNELFRKLIEGLGKIRDKLKGPFEDISEAIRTFFTKLYDYVMEGVINIDFASVSLLSILENGVFLRILNDVRKIFDSGADTGKAFVKMVNSFKGIADTISGVGQSIIKNADALTKSVTGYFDALKAKVKTDVIKDFAVAILMITGSIVVLSLIDPASLIKAVTAIAVVAGIMLAVVAILNKINQNSASFIKNLGDNNIFKQIPNFSNQLIAISASLIIASIALKSIAKLDLSQILKGLLGLAGMALVMTAVVEALSKMAFDKAVVKNISKIGFAFIEISASMVIMGIAIKSIGSLDIVTIAKGLGSIVIGLYAIVSVMNLVDSKTLFKNSLGIMVIAASLLLIGKAISDIGSLDIATIAKGLGSILIGLYAIVGITNLVNNTTLLKTSISITIMSASLLIIGKAITNIGGLNMKQIGKGLLGIAASLAAIVLAIDLMKPEHLIKKAGIMLVMAAVLEIIADVFQKIGSLPLAGIGTSGIAGVLAGIGGVLLELGLAAKNFSADPKSVTNLVTAMTAISIITPSLVTLGNMDLASIGKALLAIGGSLVIVGVAGALLSPAASGIIAVAASIFIIGVAVVSVGAGIWLFATGLKTLIDVIVDIIKDVAQNSGEIVKLLKENGENVKEILIWIVTFSTELLGDLGIEILRIVFNIIEKFLTLMNKHAPTILRKILSILLGILNVIKDYVYPISLAVLLIIGEVIKVITDNIGYLIDLGIGLVVALVDGLATGLDTHLPEIIEAFDKLASACIKAVLVAFGMDKEDADEFMTIGSNAADSLRKGLINTLEKEVYPKIEKASFDFFYPFHAKVNDMFQKGRKAIQNFLNGILNGIKYMDNAIITSILETKLVGTDVTFRQFLEVLGFNVGEGLVQGVEKGTTHAEQAAEEQGKNVLDKLRKGLDEHSPSHKAQFYGYMLSKGLIIGIKSAEGEAKSAITDFSGNILTELDEDISSYSSDSEMEENADKLFGGLWNGIKNGATNAKDFVFGLFKNFTSGNVTDSIFGENGLNLSDMFTEKLGLDKDGLNLGDTSYLSDSLQDYMDNASADAYFNPDTMVSSVDSGLDAANGEIDYSSFEYGMSSSINTSIANAAGNIDYSPFEEATRETKDYVNKVNSGFYGEMYNQDEARALRKQDRQQMLDSMRKAFTEASKSEDEAIRKHGISGLRKLETFEKQIREGFFDLSKDGQEAYKFNLNALIHTYNNTNKAVIKYNAALEEATIGNSTTTTKSLVDTFSDTTNVINDYAEKLKSGYFKTSEHASEWTHERTQMIKGIKSAFAEAAKSNDADIRQWGEQGLKKYEQFIAGYRTGLYDDTAEGLEAYNFNLNALIHTFNRTQKVVRETNAVTTSEAKASASALSDMSDSTSELGTSVNSAFGDETDSSGNIVKRYKVYINGQEASKDIQSLMELFKDNPTITPVVNLDEVTKGVAAANELFLANGWTKTYRIGAETANMTASLLGGEDHLNREDINGLFTTLREIKEEVATLGDRIDAMDVILDSGAVVGGIAPQMDTALGQKAVQSGRERYSRY